MDAVNASARPWLLGHHAANAYFAFTDACNRERPLVILASGQACVWYRLTLASKDGDWLIAEKSDACDSVLAQLASLGAHYRLGAPLDPRWLAAGWSSHFEAPGPHGERLRFDFVSRPPRIDPAALATLWQEASARPAVVPPATLIRLKQTMRLKDYPFIGALACELTDHAEQARWSIDPDHLADLLRREPHLCPLRPAVASHLDDPAALAAAIDGEIRALRQADERRMAAFAQAQQPWVERFRSLPAAGLPLAEAHAMLLTAAAGVLPEKPPA